LLAGLAVSACFLGEIVGTTTKVEPLEKKVSTYVVKGDEFKIVEHERPGSDELAMVAIQRRNLSRMELRALARHLAGGAKRPAIELLASTETYAACIDLWLARGPGRFDARDTERAEAFDPASGEACERGTVLSVEARGSEREQTVEAHEPPVLLRWGTAAPSY
jgi:hypothetical protein